MIYQLLQTTQPAPVQISALTLLLGSIPVIMGFSAWIVQQAAPYIAKGPAFIANLPIALKVAVIATGLSLLARFVPAIHTLTENPAELIAEIIVATIGGTSALTYGGNIFQSTASVVKMDAAAAAPIAATKTS